MKRGFMNKNWAIITVLLLLALPVVVRAQYICTTNGGEITITGYTGAPALPSGALTIPSTTNGLPVKKIGSSAFAYSYNITTVTIPNGVTNIGDCAFQQCTNLVSVVLSSNVTSIGACVFYGCTALTNMTIPNSVVNIGNQAYQFCSRLTSVTIPNGVTNIDHAAFAACDALNSVTIPNSIISIGGAAFQNCFNLTNIVLGSNVTNIGDYAFMGCTAMTAIYFTGNAPTACDLNVFQGDNAKIYYRPNTTGWGSFTGPTPILWNPQARNDATFGISTNWFGFTITNAGSPTIIVDACTNLVSGAWVPVSTNTLTGGQSYFSDPQWTNYPGRFYRFRAQ